MGRVLLSGRRGALYVNDINMDLGSMDVQREMLIEQRVANDAKSPLVAYLLLFFLWGLGVHRMYLGRWVSGILMAALWGLGWLTAPILIGMPVVGLVSLWVIIDIFLKAGSGLGVLQQARQHRYGRHLVVLSNYATPDIRARCAQLGVDAVFDKSNEIDALVDYCVQHSSLSHTMGATSSGGAPAASSGAAQ